MCVHDSTSDLHFSTTTLQTHNHPYRKTTHNITSQFAFDRRAPDVWGAHRNITHRVVQLCIAPNKRDRHFIHSNNTSTNFYNLLTIKTIYVLYIVSSTTTHFILCEYPTQHSFSCVCNNKISTKTTTTYLLTCLHSKDRKREKL